VVLCEISVLHVGDSEVVAFYSLEVRHQRFHLQRSVVTLLTLKMMATSSSEKLVTILRTRRRQMRVNFMVSFPRIRASAHSNNLKFTYLKGAGIA
jgi:hypothetical protein